MDVNTGSSDSATADYENDVTGSDNSGSVSVSCNPSSGSSVSLSGSPHTVTCTAEDDATNQATCSFDVNVIDNGKFCIEREARVLILVLLL